jgi:mannose-6-phosphate isomerase-like protein (cupin superfamily)
MPKVLPVDDIRLSATTARFQGAENGDGVALSFFFTEYPEGRGPDLHFHPYSEVFLVEEGKARFTIGDEELVVGGGNVVVVPPETTHGFKAVGDGILRVVGIHPSPRVIQTDL